MKIIVLMSTYNGARYLREQIDSILAQDICPGARLELLVRDDGSSDATTEILNEYQAENKLTWYSGPNLRPEKSFWHLLQNAPEADFYAFCDQDDYWHPDKLSQAVKMLTAAGDPSLPLLYCSAFTATDENRNPIAVEKNPLNRYTDYAHALIYSTAPGCTFVFNHAARTGAMDYDMEQNQVVIHDWLIHKIVTILGGRMVYDPNPHIDYRQHGNNAIGVHATGLGDFTARVKRFLSGSGRQTRSRCAKALLAVYGDRVSEEIRLALDLVANYTSDRRKKAMFLKDKRFRTGTVNDLFLKCLILMDIL